MEIYIVRHTTPDIKKGICYGQSDLDLASNHDQEFKLISKNISIKKPVKIFSSPLKRCALLAKHLGESITYKDDLKELNFGDWELKAWDDIPEEDINPWMKDFVNVAIPNGESYMQLATRVNNSITSILEPQNTETIIIVTHAGPIRAFLANLLKIDLKDSFNIKINYGDVFHLQKEGKKLKLITDVNI